MTLRKREATGTWRGKHEIVLCGELPMEEATDLSQNRLRNEWMNEWMNEYRKAWVSKIRVRICKLYDW
jgi:hypothetical protein